MKREHRAEPWSHWRVSDFFDDFDQVLELAKATELDRTNPPAFGARRQWGLATGRLSSVVLATVMRSGLPLPGWAFMSPRVVRDLPGHKSAPHPDTLRKVATLQVYLEGPEDQGTVLMASPKVSPADDRIPFLPNSGYFFQRTAKTWHRIDPVRAERWSILVPFFRNQGDE